MGDKVTAASNEYSSDTRLLIAKGEICKVVAISADINADTKQDKFVIIQTGSEQTQRKCVDQIEHAHAITVHKSQGLGVDHVTIALHETAGRHLLVRQLLYTALTRTIFTTDQALRASLLNTAPEKRQSRLYARVRQQDLPKQVDKLKKLAKGNCILPDAALKCIVEYAQLSEWFWNGQV